MARKKKVFCVEKDVGFDENRWIRQKGQFPTEADAQAWIDEVNCSNNLYRIVKEDQV